MAAKRKQKRKESIPRARPGRKSDAWRWPRARDKPGGRDAKQAEPGSPRVVYQPVFAETARELCEGSGATDCDLAKEFGVCRRTIQNWRAQHADFKSATELGKDAFDDAVERGFHERAKGYQRTTRKVEKDSQGNLLKITLVTEDVPPDPAAAFNWLKNRRSAKWRDRHEITGADGGPVQYVVRMPEATADIGEWLQKSK